MLPAGGPAAGRVGGPVRLRPVRATPCFTVELMLCSLRCYYVSKNTEWASSFDICV